MLRSLALHQLDKLLDKWRVLPRSRPSGGWLRAMRQALCMTTRQLAKSVGVTQAAVVDAERTEAKGAMSLLQPSTGTPPRSVASSAMP
ncbi:MAG TPA: hypothetical protein VNO32_61400 [Candidatus Acidoferrum sp.]|jgi:hypothetical protein|nr:hypothetical protein [Candidatus Acidoferrum sp.]